MEPTSISPDFLDDLVARTDEAGGGYTPEGQALWASPVVVDPEDLARFEGVDPFSEAYGDLQLELWSRWAGRTYEPTSSELYPFIFADHLEGRTAFGTNIEPLTLVHHHLSVARAVSALGLNGGDVLDVGAGWGLQAELLSELGFEVDVLDVNPEFVRLISERMERRGFGGRRIVGTFDDLPVRAGGYDLAYTYQALHHTPQPLATIRRFVDPLGTAARRVAFVGEPVLDMWPAWGLRTDAESLYCIRKFGWFESGWSADFLLSCIARAGLGVLLLRPITSKRDGVVAGARVGPLDPLDRTSWSPFAAGWLPGPEGLTSTGESALAFSVDDDAGVVVLDVGWHNTHPTTVGVTLLCGDALERSTVTLQTGITENVVDLPPGTGRVVSILIGGETWCPRAALGVADQRRISIEIVGVRTERARRLDPEPPTTVAAAPPPAPAGLLTSIYQRMRHRLPSSA